MNSYDINRGRKFMPYPKPYTLPSLVFILFIFVLNPNDVLGQCDYDSDDCEYDIPRIIEDLPEYFEHNPNCLDITLNTDYNIVSAECESEVQLFIDVAKNTSANIPVNSLSDLSYFAIRFYTLNAKGMQIPFSGYYPTPYVDILGGYPLCPGTSYTNYGMQSDFCNTGNSYYDPATQTCLFPYDNVVSTNQYYILENENINNLIDQFFSVPPYCGGCTSGLLVDGTDLIKITITDLPPGCSTIIYEIEYQNQAGDVCFYHDGIPLSRGTKACSSISDTVEDDPDDDCNNAASNTTVTVTDECGNTFEATSDENGEFCIPVPDEGCFTVTAPDCMPEDCEDRPGCINNDDLFALRDILLGVSTLTPTPGFCLAADVSGDGGVSTLDLIMIQRYILCIDSPEDESNVGECILVPTEVLQPVNNMAIYCPFEDDMDGEHEYCDGEIPPLTNIIVGDIDGSCGCLPTEDLVFQKQISNRSIEDFKGDYKQYFDGSDLRITLEVNHQIKSIFISTVNGQIIERIQNVEDTNEYSVSVPSQRQIYVIQYIYEDSMESALIPVL